MKSMLRAIVDLNGVNYDALMFVCPGCILMFEGGSGLHMLPINNEVKKPSWTWDGDLIHPTLSPSILTGRGTSRVCHSYLIEGIFAFLDDCTHPLAGKQAELPDLPDWIIHEGES